MGTGDYLTIKSGASQVDHTRRGRGGGGIRYCEQRGGNGDCYESGDVQGEELHANYKGAAGIGAGARGGGYPRCAQGDHMDDVEDKSTLRLRLYSW